MELDQYSLVTIIFALITGFFIVGALISFGYMSIFKKQIMLPFLFGLLVTSAFGAITIVITTAILFTDSGTLEAYIWSLYFAAAAIFAAVISGIALGILLSTWRLMRQDPPKL